MIYQIDNINMCEFVEFIILFLKIVTIIVLIKSFLICIYMYIYIHDTSAMKQ